MDTISNDKIFILYTYQPVQDHPLEEMDLMEYPKPKDITYTYIEKIINLISRQRKCSFRQIGIKKIFDSKDRLFNYLKSNNLIHLNPFFEENQLVTI